MPIGKTVTLTDDFYTLIWCIEVIFLLEELKGGI